MNAIKIGLKTTLAAGMIGLIAVGCSDRPHQYGQERPPVDQLTAGNTGLQSKDVVSATDQMAADLLALPELNASQKQWTIVVTNVDNKTQDPRFNYDVFTERLRAQLARQGHGRVALIENRDTYKNLQSKELEQGNDEFGQGGGKAQPGPVGQNPDYALRATVIEMPNRATSYYMVTFYLTNLNTRVQVWTNDYEVQAAR
jgi:hypothetical protein